MPAARAVAEHTAQRTERPTGQPAIGDYAIVGDCRTAALISRDGSVDWLCLPRFDGPSVFAAILDPDRGGRFSIRPATPYRATRRYLPDTNVLETTFETPTGTIRLTDAMTVGAENVLSRSLVPDHELARAIECTGGAVDVELHCEPRMDYGRSRARLRKVGGLGFTFDLGPDILLLRSDLPLEVRPGPVVAARARLRAGERAFAILSTDSRHPCVVPSLGDAADARMAETIRWWRSWIGHCSYDGDRGELVRRSALTLKLLTYPPSGAIVAAPTTSLPERIGGGRNWDYRYCWLRDAAFTLRALLDLGFTDEGEAFLGWMLHATRLSYPELRVLYDVHGRSHIPEHELDHLSGHRGSRPVRIGNAAARQLQLDVYGEVILAALAFTERGGELDHVEADFLSGLARTICRRWAEPDHGIWEIRAGPRHHTHSKAMCWAGLTALGTLADQGRIRLRMPRERVERERRAIRAAIEEHGFDRALGSYVATFGGTDMDATLLLLGINGYADPGGERMAGTLRSVRERLEVNELLYRYDYGDGVGGEEGAFGLCSFWETQLLAAQGRLDEARADFDHVASFANDVGLFAEQIDPRTGEALGNFPQAFTHIGLINAAAAIANAEGRAPERRAARPRNTRAQIGPGGRERARGAKTSAGTTAAGAQ